MEERFRKRVRAIIKWAAEGFSVQNIEGFDLPPRTVINMSFAIPLERKPPGVVEEALVYISDYKCVDCGFSTEFFDAMMQHQKKGKHSFKQKIKRALGYEGGD